MTEEEIQLVLEAGWARERSKAQNLVFCAKEALFKCQYPLTGLGQLDFEHVQVCRSDQPKVLKPALVLGGPSGIGPCLETIGLHFHVFHEIRLVVARAAGPRGSPDV
jgi:4'-phosphopantetheinyl transferase EntD